jgi:amidohydrolase
MDDALKVRVVDAVQSLAPDLISLSKQIHANPELGFKEFKSSAALCAALEARGIQAQRPAYGLETAFVAEIGRAGPRVALISEYDALPDVGHACGHNIIAVTGLGAALALSALGENLPGIVRYLGTPAEEGGGGKELMARHGAFEGVDCAMMVHPSTEDLTAYPLLANARARVRYRGRAAHASSNPEAGRNALDGLVLAYQSVAALRQHVPAGHRIHGVFTNGGSAANIVPELAEGLFVARAPDLSSLRSLCERVSRCFEAGAFATETSVEIDWDDIVYADMRTNWPLADAYRQNAEALGRQFERFEDVPQSRAASTDMGNVSYIVPAIHPMIGMAPKGVVHHHRDFALWSASDEGMKAAIDGAKALAMTALEFMTNSRLRGDVAKAFGSPRNVREAFPAIGAQRAASGGLQ